ncbi:MULTISPECIES: putative quinol monooxygenase [Rhodococcus]|jgi:quinol monooxygenase YgiN|uniref:putative quinol monooxygenase n=1 Tax=Rhodococcus TaxID=1827 RepID=UPI000975C02B|nr:MULTISPECIES: antibiotic biosynthesis monooxygenase [Rhodococcus]OMQ24346.1 antibiotic biosynthesis monooxygenase [Rhodococcus sp. D-1]
MSTTAVLELEFRPGTLSIAHTMLSRVLTETRAFDGCLSVEVFEDPGNDHRWVLFERWESVQHDSAYRAYRAGPGTVTQLGDILASAPALTIYAEPVDL